MRRMDKEDKKQRHQTGDENRVPKESKNLISASNSLPELYESNFSGAQ